MSLSASEQQALDSIEATLTSSDPKLASLLAIFARLASGEEMPVRERVRIHRRLQVTRGWQHKQRCSRPDKAGVRRGVDARLATLTTLAKAGQVSWCSPGDWIQGGA
jgi:hypothetical protein